MGNKNAQPPHLFEYHQYLRQILNEHTERRLFIATEIDFQKVNGITYPYRSYFYVIGLMYGGGCRIRIGTRDFEMRRQSLTIVGPGIVRCWLQNDWKSRNITLFFIPEFFQAPFYNNFLLDYPFFKSGAEHVLNLNDDDFARADRFLKTLQTYEKDGKIASGLLFAFLEFIDKTYKKITQNHPKTPKFSLVRDFDRLLQTHYQTHKEVAFYAEKMNMSSKYLSEKLKTDTGQSAKQIIEDFVLFEAKSLLKQTTMTVKEIVYWLGYEDPSYFIKVFKSRVGLTPLEYRG